MNYLGLPNKKLKTVAQSLNVLLSSYTVYYQNLRSFHWHIKGDNFFQLHELFENLYNNAKSNIDEVAERILTLRFKPLGSMSDYLTHSTVDEARDEMSDELMITTLINNHQQLIKNMRKVLKLAGEVNDEGTIDLVAGFLGEVEKNTWMLDAWKSKKFNPTIM